MSWENVPLRKLITPNNKRNRPDLPLLSVVRDKGVIKRNLDRSDNHNVIPEDLSNYKIVSEGQFVINKMKAWQGSCGVSPYNGIVSPAYFVFDLTIDNPRFFNYSIRSKAFITEFNRMSKGIRVDQWDLELEKLKYIRFPIPPREEQDQIVRYLDWKVSGINRLINAKRRQIALLQEHKRVVINDAVTKGGEGWRTTKFKRFTISANTGESITKEYWDENGDILLYTAGQQPVKTEYTKFPEKWLTTKNDILVARNGAGSVHLPVIGSIYTDHVIRFVLSDILNKKYIYYSLIVGMKKVVSEANTVSLATLNKSDWENVDISFPPLIEQQAIVDYLDEKCKKFDKLITTLNDEIALFTEYRTCLISDVVTGKFDVRGVIVPEFEAVEDVANEDKVEEINEIMED